MKKKKMEFYQGDNLVVKQIRWNLEYVILDHFLSEKVMVFDNFLAADKHK